MSTEPLGRPSPPQFTLRGLFVVTTVVALLLSLIVPLINVSRDAACTAQCVNNMKQVGIALCVYRDTWRTLPPASTVGEDGQLLHSWRTQLLPFLEHRNPSSHLRWDEPWNSANNQGVDLAYEPGILYHCPADNGGSSPRNTSYLAAIGHGTLWSRIKGRSDQTDASDSEQYILLVEGANTGIHWMEPRDWNADEVNCSLDSPTPGNISSGHAGGVNVFLGDGSVRCLPRDTPPGDLKTMLTVPGLPSTSEDGSAAKMEPSTSGDVNTCK